MTTTDINLSPEIVQRWAPLIMFNRYEQFWPTDPEAFRRAARFRESNHETRRDRGWNRQGIESEANLHDPEYYGLDWPVIDRLATRATAPLGKLHPKTRPRDENNDWGSGSAKGLFFDLHPEAKEFGTWRADNVANAIYYDSYGYSTALNPSASHPDWIALSYWYFFAQNWYAILTHEGDWEHITLYFDPTTYLQARRPEAILYAHHESGTLVQRVDDPKEMGWEDSHPVVFVSRWGHASSPKIVKPSEYTIPWRTWEDPISNLLSQPWCKYGGAWGEVGAFSWTTGPLGPWFKRSQDYVLVRREDRPSVDG